ncbi:DUF3718 domain-containing protein [Shewanella sp. KX20019]|uniref:DUF3718 domain-containing protein n=1 Tax=Shewanella sp. KX20019 TaxID=2803864 RepID=UPI0019273D4F|nr:DUF3718 domain-containing protein [Shewanella sp. KX20019]QQX81169.1 DUF3718 domain-containing protein [Shewanella sp. KX20019]
MKTGIVLTGIYLSSLVFSATAAMHPTIENSLIAVCKAATQDNLYKFNRTVKENRINKKNVFPNLVCNGQQFHDFALAQGSTKVADKIARYTSATDLEQAIALNRTADNRYIVTF